MYALRIIPINGAKCSKFEVEFFHALLGLFRVRVLEVGRIHSQRRKIFQTTTDDVLNDCVVVVETSTELVRDFVNVCCDRLPIHFDIDTSVIFI